MPTFDADAAQAYGRELLTSELIRLRPLEDRDLAHLERWWEDPEWQVFQGTTVRPRPDGASREMFRGWSANDSGGGAGFSVETRDTGEFVGHVALWGATLPARAGMLGIIVGPSYVDQGYGTEAVRIASRYAFRAMGLHRLELRVLAFNGRALASYGKAGFQQEGVRRQAVFVDGAFRDEVVMALLRDEWEAQEAARPAPAEPA